MPEIKPPVQGATAAAPEPAAPGLSNGANVPGQDATFVFKGYGRAHGVGLCMDGVRERANAGQTAMQIVNAYYTGVSLSDVDDSQPIRVKGRDGGIHTLSLHDYLCHLTEEPEDYPAEGLKVLYLAARSYTLSVIARGKHKSAGYDICSSGSCCQAFDENKDLSKYPNNIAAVKATSGQVLTYNGTPIIAAYCGSCGGHTDNNEDVWGGTPIPYLRGRPDGYCSRSPRFLTTKEMSVRDVAARFGVGELQLVDLSDRTPGGRVKTAKVVGSAGTKSISGKQLQDMCGFRTTRIDYSFK
jgi:SpoIID/LytB domain protein